MDDSVTFDDAEYYGALAHTPDDHGTSHVSVVDSNGMAVAVTSTINLQLNKNFNIFLLFLKKKLNSILIWLSLGAGFASAQTGIILNNEMADFSSPSISFYGLPPSSTNTIQPGKRPLSSMTPVIVIDSSSGGVRLVVGAAGGIRITTSTVYVRL